MSIHGNPEIPNITECDEEDDIRFLLFHLKYAPITSVNDQWKDFFSIAQDEY